MYINCESTLCSENYLVVDVNNETARSITASTLLEEKDGQVSQM